MRTVREERGRERKERGRKMSHHPDKLGNAKEGKMRVTSEERCGYCCTY